MCLVAESMLENWFMLNCVRATSMSFVKAFQSARL